MIESAARAKKLPYHKQKLTLVWSAMRHFAQELRSLGYQVDYHEAQRNMRTGLRAHLASAKPAKFRMMETADHQGSRRLRELASEQGVPVEVVPNNMFISDRAEFAKEAQGKKTLIMEAFYRKMRRRTGLLMNGKEPEGGQWNYDHLNRDRPPAGHVFPPVPRFEPDALTRRVMKMVDTKYPRHFGDASGFAMPVTREHARSFARDFIEHRLDLFGPYEDAIVLGQRTLYHSLLSPLLNLGLLEPLEVCRQAEAAYGERRARLNSVEGFIRQVLGWREFIYQVYHLRMPAYARMNVLDANLPLPDFYWTGKTNMKCVADAVAGLRQSGFNHHIQRLMVTGNFALIAGIDPQKVNEWYWLAYLDAYEWVVTPNVLGLSLYADGGLIATKPYAASANYMNKMSDCCKHCDYDFKSTVGENACPFNSLYWDFLARNQKLFKKNPRMNMMMAALAKREASDLREVRLRARELREKLRRSVSL